MAQLQTASVCIMHSSDGIAETNFLKAIASVFEAVTWPTPVVQHDFNNEWTFLLGEPGMHPVQTIYLQFSYRYVPVYFLTFVN